MQQLNSVSRIVPLLVGVANILVDGSTPTPGLSLDSVVVEDALSSSPHVGVRCPVFSHELEALHDESSAISRPRVLEQNLGGFYSKEGSPSTSIALPPFSLFL